MGNFLLYNNEEAGIIERDEKERILEQYISIAQFISVVAGPNCEVVLRDYHKGYSKIIFMVNGRLSNRKVGDEITGYTLEKIMRSDYRKHDCVLNYIIINESNQRVFRASTYYIKQGGELIGLLCVNYDLTKYLEFRDFYTNEVLYGLEENLAGSKDYFDESMDSILEGIIRNVFVHWDRNIPVKNIEAEGNPIRELYKLNVFKYKGSVNKVAELLDISAQTIYRYLGEIEKSIQE
ncbi:helix-turn-helix transcriptional regulator [Treponema phagedenis]|uniref:helix-turn-helix transcriptional regulator n=1 Tax=Treponema phagedenis TaxID=162 RepID=UPI001C06AFA0|nr:PAS domain-containing protein [Treponema phagedenis]